MDLDLDLFLVLCISPKKVAEAGLRFVADRVNLLDVGDPGGDKEGGGEGGRFLRRGGRVSIIGVEGAEGEPTYPQEIPSSSPSFTSDVGDGDVGDDEGGREGRGREELG